MTKLKRIKQIKNIGVFSNFSNGGSIGFEKLTFIYGLNTHGKTTITDIFQSLKNDDGSIIELRKTVPEKKLAQVVVLTVGKNEVDSESELIFQNGAWGKNSVAENFEVFGTEFIHKNVFTGLTIQRENKENFTQFILGEQGVKLAEQIRNKRQELAGSKKNLNNKIPNFVNSKSDYEIRSFVDFPIEGFAKNIIEAELYQKRKFLQTEQERLAEPSKILNLKEPRKFELKTNIILENLTAINDLLAEDYSNIKEESIKKLNTHLSNNFSKKDNAENWIKEGLHYCENKEKGNCPFCGQDLAGARDIIELYNSYFNDAYKEFIVKITNGLNNKMEEIENVHFREKSELQTTLTLFGQYKNLIAAPNFQADLQELAANIDLIQEEVILSDKNELFIELKRKVDEKIKSPYKKVDLILFECFKINMINYLGYLTNSKRLIDLLIERINEFKNQYRDLSKIKESIAEVNEEIIALEYKKARVELDANCIAYKELVKSITQDEKHIKELDGRLQQEQSTYLESYFYKVNQIFKALGSGNFKLEKETGSRGHLPVYSLKVTFHGVNIPSDKLGSVFSESDRRALALSVFWVKIELKSNEEKLRTVIILDDPITSFDDNRITSSINLFKEMLRKISQIVVLTHYPNFIKRFCEMTKDSQVPTKFIELTSSSDTNLLSNGDRKFFTNSDFEKIFMKIYGYINKYHTESIKTDLRPFLENLYLPTVFAKKIQEKNVDCSSLEKMIDGIFDNLTIKERLHEFRRTLNPDSHTFTSNNEEDVRGFARGMMDYLFSLNFEDSK